MTQIFDFIKKYYGILIVIIAGLAVFFYIQSIKTKYNDHISDLTKELYKYKNILLVGENTYKTYVASYHDVLIENRTLDSLLEVKEDKILQYSKIILSYNRTIESIPTFTVGIVDTLPTDTIFVNNIRSFNFRDSTLSLSGIMNMNDPWSLSIDSLSVNARLDIAITEDAFGQLEYYINTNSPYLRTDNIDVKLFNNTHVPWEVGFIGGVTMKGLSTTVSSLHSGIGIKKGKWMGVIGYQYKDGQEQGISISFIKFLEL